MKKTLLIIFVIIVIIGGISAFIIYNNKNTTTNEITNNNSTQEGSTEEANTTREGKKDIDIESLSDEEKIEHFVHLLLKETYGNELEAAKIYVDKMYKSAESKKYEGLKDLNLGEKDIAFEISLYLQPVKGADINKFTIPDGKYDKNTGWVSEVQRLGVLKYNSTNNTYSITNYGTGW